MVYDAIIIGSGLGGLSCGAYLAKNGWKVIDDTLAEGNKFVMSIAQVQGFDYWRKYENDYLKGNKKEYNKEKERMAMLLIERAEKIIPGISEHIEVLEVATPLTLKRYTGNTDGASYGWANTVDQNSPLNRMSQKTPIKNLYLSSAWTFPGGGQTPAVISGYWLGRELAGRYKPGGGTNAKDF